MTSTQREVFPVSFPSPAVPLSLLTVPPWPLYYRWKNQPLPLQRIIFRLRPLRYPIQLRLPMEPGNSTPNNLRVVRLPWGKKERMFPAGTICPLNRFRCYQCPRFMSCRRTFPVGKWTILRNIMGKWFLWSTWLLVTRTRSRNLLRYAYLISFFVYLINLFK